MQKDWTQGTIKTKIGIELFFARTGGDKQPMVLAHGITDKGLCWHQLAADLAADFDLIMYDAYGHGQSSRIVREKRFDLAEDLHDLIEALDLNQPIILGHSMGADTAANYAAQHPDQLSALLLEDPPWSDQPVDDKTLVETMQTWKKRNLAAKKKSIQELIKLKKKESPNWEEPILQPWAEAKHEVDPAIFDQYPTNRTPWRDIAPKIKVPTLIITGDRELGAIITPKLGVEAVQVLKDGEFGHISKAGHCIRYEQYKPYLTMVKLFLKQNLA